MIAILELNPVRVPGLGVQSEVVDFMLDSNKGLDM